MSTRLAIATLEPGRIPRWDRTARALTGSAVRQSLAGCGVERVLGGAPESCVVERVHIGSRLGLIVDYTVTVRRPSGEARATRLFGQMPWQDADGEFANARKKLSRISGLGEAEAANRIGLVADLGLIIRSANHDERIDGLSLIERSDNWDRLPRRSDADLIASSAASATLLAHRFGKRAVMRIEPADPAAAPIIAKLYRRGSSAAQRAAAMHSRIAGGFAAQTDETTAIPEMIPTPKLASGVLMRVAPGRSIADLPDAETRAGFHAAGRTLGVLHRIDAGGLTPYRPVDDIVLLGRWIGFLAGLDGRQSRRFTQLLARLEYSLEHYEDFTPAAIHRDFHEGQVLWASGQSTMLDFDTVRLGDPAQDVGNFLAHLRLRELLREGASKASAGEFLEGYRQSTRAIAVPISKTNVEFHRRATLLRLALIHHFSERTRHVCDALMEEAV